MKTRRLCAADPSFQWESLLSVADIVNGCELKAALFTTYDHADERLLAENLLPLLLKLRHEAEGDGVERQCFLVELDLRLKKLHNKLVVVSSRAREEPGDDPAEAQSGAYAWIWRSIRHLSVGSRHRAVQHAKLWLLHWATQNEDHTDYLEIVVSSTNLTRAAFRGQLQGAWRACIPLNSQRSNTRLLSWGLLPKFLKELSTSAGENTYLDSFVELLAHADCPKGVQFVASVPGTHSRTVLRHTPWGSAGLRKIAPPGKAIVSTFILSPFVGSWNIDTLDLWCNNFHGSTKNLNLVWIDENHPWRGNWLMPKAALDALIGSGANLLHLRHDPMDSDNTDFFHEKHRTTDQRWSHAKLYSFRRGNSRRMLITSANFSPAAWGTGNPEGGLSIENFELGVCVEGVEWPFGQLGILEEENSGAIVPNLPPRDGALIGWAQAVWNGKTIKVDCRCQGNRELTGQINSSQAFIEIGKSEWRSSHRGYRSASVPWQDTANPPTFARLACEFETVNVPIFDERARPQRKDGLPPEVENVSQEIQDMLLFEQYGGRLVTDIDDPNHAEGDDPNHDHDLSPPTPESLKGGTDPPSDESGDTGSAHRDSYSVPAFELARQHFSILDNWANQLKRVAKSDPDEFEYLRQDGQLLVQALIRQAKRDQKNGSPNNIGANLAAEELVLRLKHLSEV